MDLEYNIIAEKLLRNINVKLISETDMTKDESDYYHDILNIRKVLDIVNERSSIYFDDWILYEISNKIVFQYSISTKIFYISYYKIFINLKSRYKCFTLDFFFKTYFQKILNIEIKRIEVVVIPR